MGSEKKPVDVVVCHYNKARAAHLRYMALHAVAFLCKDRPADMRVIVADGSPSPDEELARGLSNLGAEYLHCGTELSLAQTFNAGIRKSSSPIVVTLVNDVFIEAQQVRKLTGEIRGDVGCAFPYLSVEDYGAARTRRLSVPRRCFPNRLSFNVAAFSREALEKVGLLPERMTGCYDDVVLFVRLREEGYSIVLRNVGRVVHLAQQTLKTGATSVAYEADARLFSRQYPEYWRRGVVLFHKLAQQPGTRLLYRVVESLPVGLVRRLGLWDLVWAVEPYLCAERGTLREAVSRVLRRLWPVRAPETRSSSSVQQNSQSIRAPLTEGPQERGTGAA